MNIRLLALGVCLALAAFGQTTASISGAVTDSTGAAILAATVTLANALTGYENQVSTTTDGDYHFSNVPFNSYTLTVERPGFATQRRVVNLRSNVPVVQNIVLPLADQAERVTVSAFEQALLVDPEATGTRTELNRQSIEKMPVQVGSRGLESVLMAFPGFAANANGAIHPRGAHNQMTFVVDGMPISDQLTGGFATALDPSIVQTIELFTGNIPAEYGNKISGVANITTRSGLDSGRRFYGSTETSAAQFDTLSTVTQAGGGADRWGYFGSFHASKSNRFLDQVSIDNLHNGGNTERGFLRLDFRPNRNDQLRVNLMSGRSSFQLANLRSQHENSQQQRQLLRDFSASVGYVHTLSPFATVDSTASYRTSVAQFFPSAGDTPVTASQARHLSTLNFANRINAVRGAHTLRLGLDYQHFPVSENFTFAITDPDFNHPESEEYISTLTPFDLTRGGGIFHFSGKRAGNLYTTFAEDKIRWNRFVFSLGLRLDAYRFLVNGNQIQPRIGVAYNLEETGTVFRASYNRTYQTPPNENLLLSSSEEAAMLAPPSVRQELGAGFVHIQPERQNVYEVGIQQALGNKFSLNAMYYHKNSRDMQDNDNFLNTGVIFPTSLARSRVNGFESRLAMPEFAGFTGSLSLTHFHVIVDPPFTGGLFLGNEAVELLAAGPFVIDHDQKLGMHGILQKRISRALWTSWSVRHDSGLVSNPSDPEEVANDPDYADLLPYVNLTSDPPRVRPRTIMDMALGYEHYRGERRAWELMFQVSNITNRTALYNFQSIFVGTRLVQPRTAGFRFRVFF